MKIRIYLFSLLMSSIAGLVVFGVGVPKGHTVQSHIQTIPEAWRGTWQVTVAYRNHETGDLVVNNVITDRDLSGRADYSSTAAGFCSLLESSCRQRNRRLLPEPAEDDPGYRV